MSAQPEEAREIAGLPTVVAQDVLGELDELRSRLNIYRAGARARRR